jgi:actin-like ATPase involved in cell morphogenesis
VYTLGVDLGTAYTAAATWQDGHAEIVSLGSRAAAIPSVVFLRADASLVTGDAANRRALIEPERVAREFKRRFGDSAPIMLGGTPYSPESLMGVLLGAVVDEVSARQGGPPAAVCVCHPASWGPYKTGLLREAVRRAGLHMPVTLVVEPVAAACYYSRQQRVDAGSLIAVYDLGGGTFDSAVVRTAGDGVFEVAGQPEGLEHLGGADFDAAVFEHVRGVIGDSLAALDESMPATVAAVAWLREECVSAKETLSRDTGAIIPVLLPQVRTEVRITRAEFERMIRPSLHDTITALCRSIRSAGITAQDLHSVLLVGGSSRIPLVAQLVGAELDRPVAVDAHPKHAVALGAACIAGLREQSPAARPPTPSPPGAVEGPASPGPADAADQGESPPGPRPRWSRPALAGVAAAVLLVTTGVFVVSTSRGQSPSTSAPAHLAPASVPATASAPGATAATDASAAEPADLIASCPANASTVRWGCLTSARRGGGTLSFTMRANFTLVNVNDAAHYHLHLFLANPAANGTTQPLDAIMQRGTREGTWYNVYDIRAMTLAQTELGGRRQAPDPAKYTLLCVRVANGMHGLTTDKHGGYRTGNCLTMTG